MPTPPLPPLHPFPSPSLTKHGAFECGYLFSWWNQFLWGLFKISKSQAPCSETALCHVCWYRSIILTPNPPASPLSFPHSITQGAKTELWWTDSRIFFPMSRFPTRTFPPTTAVKLLGNSSLHPTFFLRQQQPGIPQNPSSSEYAKLCALTAGPRPGRITEPGRHHVFIVFAKKRFFSQRDVGRQEQRQGEKRSARAAEMRMICLRHNSAGLLSSEGGEEEGRRNPRCRLPTAKRAQAGISH